MDAISALHSISQVEDGIDGNMDGHMDIEHLKCASNSQLGLQILLEEALEGLWKGELKGEPFCLWVVLK